jgi:hypothetical protein
MHELIRSDNPLAVYELSATISFAVDSPSLSIRGRSRE